MAEKQEPDSEAENDEGVVYRINKEGELVVPEENTHVVDGDLHEILFGKDGVLTKPDEGPVILPFPTTRSAANPRKKT